ncbi:hypothetical protein GWL_09990 [Herbaspirillum sp. GW103]|uniref:hypothetical protein n=1 Tax=Herbaspirillum sp. GW103 TaxID=1175306 RepID=UPI00025E49C5|nr:hypothetical protein [Herbaspirillum sp. GW103]EIJ46759.1 hypothetical protein GWL_09990 [Herbaspirillum sp. GW103]
MRREIKSLLVDVQQVCGYRHLGNQCHKTAARGLLACRENGSDNQAEALAHV